MRSILLVCLIGCGRIGLDPIENRGGDAGASDATTDSTTDAPRVCPADMTPLAAGELTCIEKAERGTETWTNADRACTDAGRRLCRDAEWALACEQASGLVEMANDGGGTEINWEWVAEVDADIAQKRGLEACSDMSAHEIFLDPYDFRCCLDI